VHCQAGATGDGSEQGGAAHVYPGAAIIPGQAIRLVLPRGLALQVGLPITFLYNILVNLFRSQGRAGG